MSSLNSKNKIIASTDKLAFSSNFNHQRIMRKFLDSKTSLKNYDLFLFSPKILSFKRVGRIPILRKNDSNRKYVSPFANTDGVTYKDIHGRKFHLKYRYPGTSMAAITIEFYPNIKYGFDFNLIIKVFQELKLDYKNFNITYMEFNLDFYGNLRKNINDKIWSQATNIFYCYTGTDGEWLKTSDPTTIPEGVKYSRYLGKRNSRLQVKAYWKPELKCKFNRVEVAVRSGFLKKLGVHNLDDLIFKYGNVLTSISNTFKLAKINRKQLQEDMGLTDRYFNGLKKHTTRHKALFLYDKFQCHFISQKDFNDKYVETLKDTDKCFKLWLRYFKKEFFKGIDSVHLEKLREEHECRAEQYERELAIKESYKKRLADVKSKSEERMDVRTYQPILDEILNEISNEQRSQAGYIGGLYGSIIAIERSCSTIRKEIAINEINVSFSKLLYCDLDLPEGTPGIDFHFVSRIEPIKLSSLSEEIVIPQYSSGSSLPFLKKKSMLSSDIILSGDPIIFGEIIGQRDQEKLYNIKGKLLPIWAPKRLFQHPNLISI